jgi:hypothetical protein
METIDDVLAHFGIKGMKWGVRRPRGSDGTVGGGSHETSPDAQKAQEYKQRAKASGTHSLANHELQHLVNRMNLEQQYTRMVSTGSKKSAGAKFAKELLVSVGKQQATKMVMDATTKAVASTLKK